MRKCVRCNTEMNEELEIKVDMQSYGISVSYCSLPFGKTDLECPYFAEEYFFSVLLPYAQNSEKRACRK